ncbi:MAG TPA: hypothetical protein DIT80_01360 [Lachnospiraceae bacterium]|nr:hypothetical protein [Lachnospiraceae bacterium]
MMMRRQIAVALTGIIAGNTVLFAQAAATTETQSQRTADRYMIIDLAGIPFTWTDESLTEIQVSEAASTEFEDFSESSLEAEEPPYYMSLTSLDNEYIEHLDQFDSLKNITDPIDMYTGSQMAYAVSDIRTDESIISYLLDQYAGYDTYSAVEFYEVASLKPADENGIYSLLLQQEEENADVVHYSVADGTLQKSAVEAVLNEYGQPSYSLETTTNHWMIVHLVSKVPAEGQDTVQTEEKETDEEASRSLEGALEEDNADPTGSSRKDSQTSDYAAATSKSSSETKLPETTKPAQTNHTATKPAQTTQTPTVTTTTAAQTTAPTTTAHTHNWVAVTKTVHHDAVTSQVWKEDTAAWDETVVTKAAWDEQVLSQATYDEQVLVSEAYDEPVYAYVEVCNACGHAFLDPNEDVSDHMEAGCWSSWHGENRQVGTTHHDAVYNTVHHDAVYTTVHHDAETTVVHHEATGHYETVVTQAAWDETVTTGYKCSGCGATK